MTLEEAYAKLRRENLVLKNRVRILESEKDREKLEKAESARAYWKEMYDNLHETSKRNRIELEGRVALLERELAKAEGMLAEKDEEIARLNMRLAKDHLNSSIPSSSTSFPERRKIPNSRERSGRKPGAQNGHAGHRRRRIEDASCSCTTVSVGFCDGRVPENWMPTGRKVEKFLYDIEVGVACTKYLADEYLDMSTGYLRHAPFPQGISNETTYGPGIRALAWYLCNVCNVSVSKTASLIGSMTGGRIRLSTGFVSQLSRQMSSLSEKERGDIFGRLEKAAVMHTDITVGNMNGHFRAVNVFTDNREVLYLVKKSKSATSIGCGTPLEGFAGTLVHDHDVTYYRFGTAHQECLAHLSRYLKGAIELEPRLTWHIRMRDLFRRMIGGCGKGDVSAQQKAEWIGEYDRILDLADREYAENPPGEVLRDGINLARRLREYKEETLLFLERDGVAWTNNVSERLNRQYKRHQKACGCFRSERGIEDFAAGLSIIETEKFRGGDPMRKVESIFSSMFGC